MANIMILGSGGWGIALACSLDKQGHRVTLWSTFENEVEALLRDRANEKLLKGVKISESIGITSDISIAKGSDIVIIAVPSFAVRATVHKLADVVSPDTIVVNVAKGFEQDSLKCLSQVIKEELPMNSVAVLSGPSHAEEVALSVPTSLVVACNDCKAAEYIQDTIISPTLRIYTHDDVTGVEIGGALKNVIALCAGICDGLKLGDNTKAALMTRGLTEIARLGVAMGAREGTFAGLTGLGDLIVTCMSMHSRNRRFGILIGEGVKAEQALKEIGMTVEGYHAAAIAKQLSVKYRVEMPITEQCFNILYKNASPQTAISNLMQRPKKHEHESAWMDK